MATGGTNTHLLITCEHAGNTVPPRYAPRFAGRERVLASHRGYDPGSLELARLMARRLAAPLFAVTVTRLLVEVNRSLGHPRLFSEFTCSLPDDEKLRLVKQYYSPHRKRVADWIAERIAGGRVIHVSVHSFAPVLRGQVRVADIGLLFDPKRESELALCRRWQRLLRMRHAGWRVRRNYPYRGTSDGLTTSLRQRFDSGRYLGIELEVNQRWPRRGGAGWARLQNDIAESLAECLES